MSDEKSIRVFYDPQIFLLQKYGGISRYFVSLVKEFEANPSLGITPIVNSRASCNEYALNELPGIGLVQVTGALNSLAALVRELLRPLVHYHQADIVHSTFYLPGFLRRGLGLPKVVTLFDMIPENTPRGLRFWNPHFLKKSYLRQASAVVSISDASTEDMLREYRLPIPAITTYLGVGSEFQPNLPKAIGLPEAYFLFVGNRGGYKDWETALRAFSEVAKSFKHVQLQLAGGGALTRQETRLLREFGVEDRIVQREISDQDLPSLYSNAKALLYTTQYEGFGLPLVEAMASGTIVFAADTQINREIAGESAIYFEVSSSGDLSKLMSRVLDEPSSFSDKIERGLDRAKSFTWGPNTLQGPHQEAWKSTSTARVSWLIITFSSSIVVTSNTAI
jgi:glycosyltransferase involved in cell wall biosynthesis